MERYIVGKWTVDPLACTLSCDDESKQIEPKCMELLVLLVKADGEVVSRADIMDSVWLGRYVTDHVLNNLVAALRKHLRDTDVSDYIKTRPKRGYQLTVPIKELSVEEYADSTSLDKTEPAVYSGNKKSSPLLLLSVFLLMCICFGVFIRFVLFERSEVPLSVAVMPFEVLDSEEPTQYFAEGLVDETIHNLSAGKKLKVASRSSSQSIWAAISEGKSSYENVPFNYVLEGSVRPQQQLFRVTARLVNGQSGNLLWSRVFTANRESVLTAQNDISQQLTQAISESLDSPDNLMALEQGSVPNEAYLHVLRGRKLNSDGKMDSYIKALDEFKMATLIAPDYLDAHADLALNYLILAQQKKMDPEDANRMAFASIQRALEIDPNHAKSHSMNATYYQNIGEYALAERSYRKALSLDPELYVAVVNFANMMRLQHRYIESLEMYEKARELAPRSSGANWAIGSIFVALGRFDEALAQYQKCVDLLPEFDACVAGVAYVNRITNQSEAADQALTDYVGMVGEYHYWYRQVVAWHRLWQGDIDGAEQVYQELINQFGYAIDGIDSISLMMWRKQVLTDWIEKLAQVDKDSDDVKITAALAYSHYLGGQCKESIGYAETLWKNSPHYFSELGIVANGFSYRAALAFCYKQTGNSDKFKQQLTDLAAIIDTIPQNQYPAPGILLLKAQYYALSDNMSGALNLIEKLQQSGALIHWLLWNDPILRQFSESMDVPSQTR